MPGLIDLEMSITFLDTHEVASYNAALANRTLRDQANIAMRRLE